MRNVAQNGGEILVSVSRVTVHVAELLAETPIRIPARIEWIPVPSAWPQDHDSLRDDVEVELLLVGGARDRLFCTITVVIDLKTQGRGTGRHDQ